MISRSRLIITCGLLTISCFVFSQNKTHQQLHKEKIFKSLNIGKRSIFSPVIDPIAFPLFSITQIDNSRIDPKLISNYRLGFKVINYTPKKSNYHNLLIAYNNTAMGIEEVGIFSLKSNNVQVQYYYTHSINKSFSRKYQPILNLGISTNFSLNNQIIYGNSTIGFESTTKALRPFFIHGLLGFGFSGFTFKGSASGHFQDFSIDAILPIGNWSNLFKSYTNNIDQRLEPLYNSKTNQIGVQFSWRHYLHVEKNRYSALPTNERNKFLDNPENISLFQPPGSLANPSKNVFGGFYLENVFSPFIDTLDINFETESFRGLIFNHHQLSIGYTLNFIGNYQKDKNFYISDKGFRWSSFISAALQRESYNISNTSSGPSFFNRQNYNVLSRAGVKIGNENGLNAILAYRFQSRISQSQTNDNMQTTISSDFIGRHGGEVFIGYKSYFHLGVIYNPIINQENQVDNFQGLSLGVRVGF